MLKVSTTTAELGKPLPFVATAGAGLEPDLDRSTTDTYAVALAGEAKPVPDGKDWPLQVLPLAVGKLPVTIYWKQASGGGPATSVALQLDVTEPAGLAPDAELQDIKSPARAKPLLWPWLLAAALLALALYAWRRLRRAPSREAAPEAPPDPRSPAQRAFDELAALEASGLWAERRYREFYFQLTEILRGYLERRYGMPALKLTTHELARQLRQAEADRQAIQLFKELFDRADLVKFAKTTPDPRQGEVDLVASRRLVSATSSSDLAAHARAGESGGRP